MKNYILPLLSSIIFISCNNDDSSSAKTTSLAPSGALIKHEIHYTTTDVQLHLEYLYNTNETVNSEIATLIQPGFNDDIKTNDYNYNANNQIWKFGDNYRVIEYQFSNNLIINSSMLHISSGNTSTQNFTYNSNNQILKTEFFDNNNNLTIEVLFTYDLNGNILTEGILAPNGDSKSYIYEYDNYNNPMSAVFAYQEIQKVLGVSPNNKTKRTYNNNGTITVFTAQYTYNSDGYPLTKTEYQNGTTLVEDTVYIYQP